MLDTSGRDPRNLTWSLRELRSPLAGGASSVREDTLAGAFARTSDERRESASGAAAT